MSPGALRGAHRFVVRLPERTYEELRALAALSPYSMNDLVLEGIERYIEDRAPRGSELAEQIAAWRDRQRPEPVASGHDEDPL